MKKLKNVVWMTGMLLAGVVVFAGAMDVKADKTEDTIADGVYIGSIDVGGMTVDEAQSAVDDYVSNLMDTTFTLKGYDGEIEVTAEDMGLHADNADVAERAYAVTHTGSLINRYKETKDLEKTSIAIDMGLQIDKQATAMLIYDKQGRLGTEAVDNGLVRQDGTFVFVSGQIGHEVDIVASVNEINNYLANEWDGETNEITLVTTEVEPKGTEEELAQVKDLLGSFSTNFSTSGSGRKKNVINGCAKIDGTVLYPGEEFSVYGTVSPFTQENGYELAGAYQNGTTVESFGGGICQVSSTLYNAVIRAELDITMRYNHSMLVSYVPPSDDAAIAGTYKDLRFVNNLDAPIYIEGYCSNGIITFNIYGHETREAGRKVSFESEIISQDEQVIQFNQDGAQVLGYWNVEQSAHLGTVSRLWKIVTVGGVEQSREVFNNSTYQASPKIITIGTAGATAEQLDALNAAIATNDEATVKAVVESFANPVQEPAAPPVTETSGTPAENPNTPAENPNTPAENPDNNGGSADQGTESGAGEAGNGNAENAGSAATE